jgi:superfamily II DNA or RNA helicase
MPTIYDNISGDSLAQALVKTLETAKRADFCIGYFNLRGWDLLCKAVDGLPGGPLDKRFEDEGLYHARVLIGMQKRPEEELEDYFSLKKRHIDNARANEIRKESAAKFRRQLTIGLPTNKDEAALRKLSRQLRSRRVAVKLHLGFNLHAKLYLAYREDYNAPIIGYLGSSNLTFSGLSRQGELNVDVSDHDAGRKLETWFQNRWDDQYSIDITKDLAEIIDQSWASETPLKPYYIYMKMVYHLSQEARSGIAEFSVPKALRNILLPFQQNAVQVAARHLHKRGGVMLGDVVGLGKTITATALAKMFEDDFGFETLILCPPALQEMWNDYLHEYQLRAKTMSLGEVQNKLKDEKRYRIVIIDESHNLRNRESRRYRAISEYLALNDSKVILLTATPYNKSYLDMSSQLRLFLGEHEHLGISPEQYIKAIGGAAQFEARHQVNKNTIAAFEKSDFSEDWAALMRQFLVRRTRSFIKANYAKTDSESGRKYLEFSGSNAVEVQRSYFPDRIPVKAEYPFKKRDRDDQYARLYSDEVVSIINKLLLPRYGLGHKDYEDREASKSIKPEEIKIKANLAKAGRQLRGFARTNLFKRLESSGYSFLLSISRHILRNYLFIYAIENNLEFPVGKQDNDSINNILYSDKDIDEENDNSFNSMINFSSNYADYAKKYYQALANQKQKYEWIRSSLFNEDFKKDIETDTAELLKILEKGKSWEETKDRQLNALHTLISKKHPAEKILIFTQYSDTAYYLYNALLKRGITDIECATGSSSDPTDLAYRFSPESNREHLRNKAVKEIRVLVTTDVLSEGQNLQDCHIVVNYDLPWAIIRLIQRAGRVDRIGQKSNTILCYSFLPEDGLETILDLRGRLKRRIKENAEALGSDEVFFDGDPVNIKDLYNEKAGILDEDDEAEVDLSSYCYQIWKNGVEAHPELKTKIPELPDVVYAAKKAETYEVSPFGELIGGAGELPIHKTDSGVIVYARTSDDIGYEASTDCLTWLNEKGEVVTQSPFEILKAVQCGYAEKPLPRQENHHALTTKAVQLISETADKLGGQLGKTSGARYRAYMRLDAWIKQNKDSLFVTEEIKRIHEDLYNYPLQTGAKESVNRELKSGVNDETLIAMLTSLREDGKLSDKDENKRADKDARIICSMGLVTGE